MTPESGIIGDHLRRIRAERQLSLASVAQKADISVATLSRIETNKQNIGVALLMTLARVLAVAPAELLGEVELEDDSDALVRALAKLRTADRARVFIDSSRRRDPHQVSAAVDDLLVTIDVLREELMHVKRAMGRRKR